jgi:hypothetical protein
MSGILKKDASPFNAFPGKHVSLAMAAAAKAKTVRFEKLVKQSGVPEQATLWVPPEKDPRFMRAVRENRVVTLCQQNVGTKKDYGLIGFFKEKNAAFLIFPRKLSLPAETKVIGIKYDKLAAAKPRGPIFKSGEAAKPKKVPVPGPPAKPEKAFHRFRAPVRLIAEQTLDLDVEAASKSEAKKLLEERARHLELNPISARIVRKVGAVKRR